MKQRLTGRILTYGTGIRRSIRLSYGRVNPVSAISYHKLHNHANDIENENQRNRVRKTSAILTATLNDNHPAHHGLIVGEIMVTN